MFIILLTERDEIFTLPSIIGRASIPQMAEDLIGGLLSGLHLAGQLPHHSSSTCSIVFFLPG